MNERKIKKGPVVLREMVNFWALHPSGDDQRMRFVLFKHDGRRNCLSSTSISPDLGDTWRHGCPQGPAWDSDVGDWTGSEGASSYEVYEHNFESPCLEVIGQNWSALELSCGS